MSTPATQLPDAVSTALYIGGKQRQTKEQMAIADPGKAGGIVGYAASATPQDVLDAVAAAKAAYPAWSALTPQQRAEKMKAAIEGVPDSPNPFASEDGAILSQENGKVRLEGWVDALVLQIRWNLALMHADEVNSAKVLKPVPGHIPTETTVSYQPLGVCSIIVPFNWPIAILGAALPHALLAGNTGDREAAADRAARHRARRAAHRREAAPGRAERHHRSGRQHEGAGAEPGHREGVLHRLRWAVARRSWSSRRRASRASRWSWAATMRPSS